MRILKAETLALLEAENTCLDTQISLCHQQEQTMLAVSLPDIGLQGDSFAALEERIKMRPSILRIHIAAYEEIKRANEKHSLMLSSLPDSLTLGVLDTAECDAEITRLRNEIDYLRGALYNLSATIDSYESIRGDDSPPSLVYNAAFATYSCSIEALEEAKKGWITALEAASDYERDAGRLYNGASDFLEKILGESTNAIRGCIERGSYSAQTMLENFAEYRCKLAEEYLSSEELRELKIALYDGILDEADIYSGDPKYFDEDLYTILLKLPDSLVLQSDVEAIADIYNTMWINGDTFSIERIIELSYVNVSGVPRFLNQPEYNEFELFSMEDDMEEMGYRPLFAHTSFLDRLAAASLEKLQGIEKDSENYQRLLAGANVLDVVSRDEHIFYTEKVDVELVYVEGEASDEGAGALTCLTFNSSESHRQPWLMTLNGGEDELASAFSLILATGDLTVAANTMNALKNDYLADGEFDMTAFMAEQGIATVLGYAAGAAGSAVEIPLIPITAMFDYWKAMEEAERANVAEDNRLGDLETACFGLDLLHECGFALNTRLDGNNTPGAFLSPDVRIHFSSTAETLINDLAQEYNKPTEDWPYIDVYDASLMRREIEESVFNSIISGRTPYQNLQNATVEKPDYLVTSPNITNEFLHWAAAPADLVYKEGTVLPDGSISSREKVIENPPSNYSFFKNRKNKDSMCFYFEYRSEQESQ